MTNHPEIPVLPENPVFEDTVELCSGNAYTLHPENYNYFWFDVDWSIQDGPELSSNDSLLTSPNQTTTYIFTADHECSDLSIADTITLELPVNLNVELSVDSNTFISQEGSALLQWLDCGNDFAEIPQETSGQFSPEQPGSYALMITKDSCQFITDCFSFPVVSVEEMPGLEGISIHPNPTKNKVIIESSGQTRLTRYELFDYTGRKVNEGVFSKSRMNTVTLDGESGIYVLRIFSEDGDFLTRKLVKQ